MKREVRLMKTFGRALLLLTVTLSTVWGQYGDRQFRRTGILNGNQVRTVFGNWGVVGQPGNQGKRGAWKDDNNGYLGDISPILGAEVKWRDTTFHAVVTTPTARPQANPISADPRTGKQWTLEPQDGYFAPSPNERVALSNDPTTWPAMWPDRLTDAADPGWKGKWNGYFGKRASADLETYYVMDDNNFERFNAVNNNGRGIAFLPDSTKPNRNGLGLVVKVRGLQWSQFLAQDNIFWLYEITNTGTTTYDKTLFGMIVGTYVGVTSTEGAGEYDDDWSFYDVRNNITYTGDFDHNTFRNPRWNSKYLVGMVGYAFLESPGNPYDGIDNDGDADSSTAGLGAPPFSPASFSDSTVILPGQRLVIVREDFTRQLVTVPSVDSFKVKTRGMRDSVWIYPGVTKRRPEGNEIFVAGQFTLNPNAYDGMDNNFNGLVDENYYLHYRQLKRNPNPGQPPLIDTLRIVRHINYLTGSGTSPNSMLDEKRDDRVDNDNDWSRKRTGEPVFDPDGNLLDDVGRDGVQYSNDFGERDGQPTSGYDNLGRDTGLPGEPRIDKTDVKESDQIGLSSFYYFSPAGDLSLGDDEFLWRVMSPGFFSVPTSIVQNQPQRGEDGDFTYSSGYFPLRAGETERFSIALVYGGGKGAWNGWDKEIKDLLDHKKTVQKIYDANYQFAVPPDRPTLTAVPGDRQVTLYWDRAAETSIDPILKTRDFEGYKIYKSTDPNFSDVFTITDGSGTARGYVPLVQYDLVDSVQGYFRATGELFEAAAGYNILLGSETGLLHSYVDNAVDNGRTYYYAIVAYDKGSDSLLLFPSENDFKPSVSISGRITKPSNTVIVIPNAKAAGYLTPETGVQLTHANVFGTGNVVYNVVDQTKLTGHAYTVTFLDSQVDTTGGVTRDTTKWNRITRSYSVKDNQQYTEVLSGNDTVVVRLSRKSIDPLTFKLTNSQGAVVPPAAYILDTTQGTFKGARVGSLPAGRYTATYQYYPVYRSTNIQGTPYQVESKDSDIFDGVSLVFNNAWGSKGDPGAQFNEKLSIWNTTNRRPAFGFARADLYSGRLTGIRRPADYEIQWSNSVVDTSQFYDDPFDPLLAAPVNFRVLNTTDSLYCRFYFYDKPPFNVVSPGDGIVILDPAPDGRFVPSWNVDFLDSAATKYGIQGGEKLALKTTKPFRKGDVFTFSPQPPRVEVSARDQRSLLDRVHPVPNPYVTASAFEPPLPPGVTSGRGQRKIDFIHMPVGGTVRIFTSRGEHVATLVHEGQIEDGTVSWNLKTKENLDVAYGVYFYVVESPIGTKTGKLAIIK